MLGTALPMVTLLVRSPIYTRIYSPELYGIYSLVYITFTYLSAISYQWITNNTWRFYLKYKKTDNLTIFWSVTFWLYIIASIVIAVICLVWYLLSGDLLLKKLIIYGGLYFITNEFLNTMLVPARIDGKSGYYNIINSSRAILSFVILLLLTFVGNLKIEAFFIAPLIINALFISFFFLKPFNKIDLNLNIKLINHSVRFIRYGSSNLLFNIGIFILISSDRYLIAFFDSYPKVGIYNQIYNLSQITISALFTVFQAAMNPTLIAQLEKKPFASDCSLYEAIYTSVYLFFPLTVICSIFSKEISIVLLGEEFREAWNIMPLVFISAFIAGLNHFAVIKIKFMNKLKYLIIDSLTAALLNILLNLVLIPIFGYKIAALTTLIAYLYLIIILFYHARLNPFEIKGFTGKILKIFLVLIFIVGLHFFQIKLLPINYPMLIAIIKTVIFVSIYFLLTRQIAPLKSE